LLRKTYHSILRQASEKRCKSVAIPLLSAGANGYPKKEAYEIAASSIRSWLSAHYASANFALLLMYDELDELKERLYELINTLKQTDEEHDLNFHVGIDPLNIKLDEKGKPVKLQDLDIELEYNNACTARATLEESDDTAIAVFDEKLFEEQRWFDTVVEHQRSAIENEEFVVYYQPKYNPNNDELSGAEALIRWNSPEFGIVPPGRFIPIFEKNGFITEIDHYMIEHVARDQKRWYDQGYKCVPVSVNVSRAHFVEPDLAEQIRNMVDAADARRSLIEIELTESAFFDDKKAIINTIKKLKEYGFAVSMDDFGSGYSSLNSLKDMPLDVLKLDAEFFRGDLEDERGEIVVSGAINLAKNLHMRTVAEGVEKRDQVEFLAKQGCDMIQGYIYDKPMPGNEFEKRMKSPAS
jgi:EAL domain-containing protein (putative c-di-GMP-specific phosphodiesterase class I)